MTQRKGNQSNGGGLDLVQPERVVDFAQAREQKMEEKRRATERIIFKSLISVFSVKKNSKLVPIELVNVSESGCAFQVPFDAEQWTPESVNDVPIRFYFSRDTYLEIFVKILHSRPSIENGARYTRFGCAVDHETKSYPAYAHFVQFLKLYAEHAHKDLGDISSFYI